MYQKKFYVTTPIYYVTAKPHLGSLYSTLLADVAARWHKLQGEDVFFLTGTDEHGQKIAQAAHKAGKAPQEFVDSFIEPYKDIWHKYDIAYTYFIRTTDATHVKAVQEWIRQRIKTGDIYKSFYRGFYCTHCETYVLNKDEAIVLPPCESCGRETIEIAEESYFFKLSAYQDRLLAYYKEHSDFIAPKERLHEVVSFVQSGLKDLSISRTTVTWGIPFPDDERHVVYVWADALNNYITALGYAQEGKKDEFPYWWPADLHVMGKDIIRFHAVYWPAFLMASGLALPKKLLVHGWLQMNKQKMSKSVGNVVDPQALLDAYGADAVRYYLTRFMAITQDSEFSTEDLEQRINSDLANDFGNLLQRVLALAQKREVYEVVPPDNWGTAEIDLRDAFWTMLENYTADMDECYSSRALGHLWGYIHQVNAYFHGREPWKITDKDRFNEIISASCHSLYAIGILVYPVMPQAAEKLFASLGVNVIFESHNFLKELSDNPWKRTFMLHPLKEPLFKKYERTVPVPVEAEAPSMPEITIEDFVNVILLVGTIEMAEEIAGSDKLLKLQVNFGTYGMRQILSGIKKYYLASNLKGLQAVFVVNLKPRKMMGLESHGMVLTVTDAKDNLKLVTVEQMPPGTRLK
jgi:methionyl-tRNA synthetase